MSRLRDAMAYICARYRHPEELSKARLTKMVYLADWRSSLRYGRQITEVEWEFNHYGPFVHDVEYVARNDAAFEIKRTTNFYGSMKEVIGLRVEKVAAPTLSQQDREVLDEVISITEPKYWDDFIRLVYSTYPILTQPRYSRLDLPELAREYKANPFLSQTQEPV